MAGMGRRILLLGCGAFGRVHLAALDALGLGADVTVFDPDPQAAAATGRAVAPSLEAGLAAAEAAVVVTPVQTHVALAEAAMRAGCDLFLEKPATETAAEAHHLAAVAAETGRIAQVGLYFRFHPKAQAIARLIARGGFGPLHYLAARFSGLKRARADSGALLNDAVHFADLLPWLAGEPVESVFAQTADPLGRGREDLAVLHLRFASGAAGLIEAGCVLPGRWPDSVVPGAETRKEIVIAGRDAVAEVDFAAETLALRRGRHDAQANGAWIPTHGPRDDWWVPDADPVGVVTQELRRFLQCAELRIQPEADLLSGAVAPARILDAARLSAREGRVVSLKEIP